MTTNEQKKILPSIGRLSRSHYVSFQVLMLIVLIALIFFNYVTFNFLGQITWNEMNWLMFVFIAVEVYLTAMRLQDCNVPGWFSLVLFIRVLILPIILFLCINPGTKGANKFGDDPREDSSTS